MSITKNFDGFVERIDYNKIIFKDDKVKFVEKLQKLENFANESEKRILENSSYISTDLRQLLEIFLERFIFLRVKENYKEIDNSEYLNSILEDKIKYLDKLGYLPKYIKNILFWIKNRTNDNLHYKKDDGEAEAIKFNKSSLVDSLQNIYNLLYWYFGERKLREFNSSRYYKITDEREPNAEVKVKEIFPDEKFKNIVINDQKILNILFDKKIKFIIPNYQRKYAWTEEEIDELFLDLKKSVKYEKNHFFGFVILSNLGISKKKINIAKVIDGQQRFTTITLIVRALYNTYNSLNKNKKIDENLTNFLTNKNIPIDRFDNENSKIVFKKIWNGSHRELYDPQRYKIEGDYEDFTNTKIFKAFSYILKIIKKYNEEELDDLYTGLRNLVVGVSWIKNYDEFELFESINSKGLRLTNFDIFKSFILSLADKSGDEDFELYEKESNLLSNLFEEYISNKLTFIEKKGDDFEEVTDNFFLSYVKYYSNEKPNKNRIFTQFKREFNKKLEKKFNKIKDFYLDEFTEILYELSIYLNAFLLTESGKKEVWKKSVALKNYYKYFYSYEATVFSPILISYFLKSKNIIYSEHGNIVKLNEENELIKILKLIEAWRIRVLICTKHNNQINISGMPNFIKKFNKKYNDNNIENFYEILKKAIDDEKDGLLEYSTDNEFLFSLQEPIDNFSTIKNIIFKIIQNNDADFDVYNQEKYDVYSLIEKTEKKRGEYSKEFLNLTEEKLSKLGNYFFHSKIKLKRKKEYSISSLNYLNDDNFTTNINNKFEVLSVKDLIKYKNKDIDDYIIPRTKTIAINAVKLFKTPED
ncbi:MAG: hypothetical protein HPAVJP_1860 [Candidatus Hepatoplasma vulgare]|nr:MAG: hypothetical protein HPAVJP_1860 [Candidatus Hepatoplasma sp.]